MRILFVTPFYYPERQFGGPPLKIHALGKGLRSYKSKVEVEAEGDTEVEVVTFDHADRYRCEKAEVEDVPVQYLPWIGHGLRQWPRRQDEMARVIQQADVVHCFGLYSAICPLAVREASRQRKPIVIEPLGMFPPRARNQFAKRLYNQIVTKRMFNRAAAVIATSEAEAVELEEIAPPEKIHFRRNGIDVAAFADLPSGKELRERWGVADEEKLILFVGRLSPIKNLEQLIAAFESVNVKGAKVATACAAGREGSTPSNLSTFSPSHVPAKLVLVGPSEPEYEKILRRQVEQLGLGDQVVFAGPLYEDEQKAALSAADLFILPSLNESFGNAAGEAVAAGVPVLLTETCGIAPLIHQRAGLAVPLGVESLADGIRKMLDREFRGQMTARREEVKRELSWDEPIAQTIALYEQILRKA